jgi:beta-lactamase regulating signal transducer with metallopeptidase domain
MGEPIRLVGTIWICGTLVFVVIAFARIRSFHKLLRQTRLGTAELQRRVWELAQQMGLKKMPLLQVTDACLPPLVWGVGRRTTLLLPARLLDQLADSKVTAVLAHELTHVRRKDSWIRWCELVAVSVYWWCPFVWFARHKLQEAEERCCDADVLRRFPNLRTCYGSALLETLEFLSQARCPAVVSTGFGRHKSLKRRFELIVSKRAPVRPNRALWCAMVLTAVATLVVMPRALSLASDDAISETDGGNAPCTITLKDGSLINGSIVSLGGDQIVIKLHSDESQLSPRLFDNVAKIEATTIREVWELSLAECIRIALQHDELVQVAVKSDGTLLLSPRTTDAPAIWDLRSRIEGIVRDIESAYWDVWLAYRDLDAVKASRDEAQSFWQSVASEFRRAAATEPGKRLSASDEARARLQYYKFRARVEQCLTDLYKSESRLRHLLEMAASDGRLIRPSDQPDMARKEFEWGAIQKEALNNRVEIAAQKQAIMKREELAQRQPARGRRELSGVRHQELLLGREKAILSDLELEVSHQLADAVRDADLRHSVARTNQNRAAAARSEATATMAAFRSGIATFDLALDAQRRAVEATRAHNQAQADYVRAVAQVDARKGSLLTRHGLELAESEQDQ